MSQGGCMMTSGRDRRGAGGCVLLGGLLLGWTFLRSRRRAQRAAHLHEQAGGAP